VQYHIEVADLATARKLAEGGTGRKLETYKGFYGQSFLLPPMLRMACYVNMHLESNFSRVNCLRQAMLSVARNRPTGRFLAKYWLAVG
jgi:hypothetical protein